jgi:hypothetical protein
MVEPVKLFVNIGAYWWKVPFYDQQCCSSKMVAMAAILNLVSV